jgi:hypothetical protein
VSCVEPLVGSDDVVESEDRLDRDRELAVGDESGEAGECLGVAASADASDPVLGGVADD